MRGRRGRRDSISLTNLRQVAAELSARCRLAMDVAREDSRIAPADRANSPREVAQHRLRRSLPRHQSALDRRAVAMVAGEVSAVVEAHAAAQVQ